MREFARTATAPCPIGQTRSAGCPRGARPTPHRPPPSLSDRRSVAHRIALDSAARASLPAARPHGHHGGTRATRGRPRGPRRARGDRGMKKPMWAAVIRAWGGPEQLALEQVERPAPPPGWITVRVEACALNHLDIHVRNGLPGVRLELPHVSGGDVVGIVEEATDEAGERLLGSRVLLDPMIGRGILGEHYWGGLAEYVVAPAANAIPLPAGATDPARYAALPIAYGTAQRMLFTRARLQHGESVLLFGATGGVGVACAQLAVRSGARVIACSGSPTKLARLRTLGVAETLDAGCRGHTAPGPRPHRRRRRRGGRLPGQGHLAPLPALRTPRRPHRDLRRDDRLRGDHRPALRVVPSAGHPRLQRVAPRGSAHGCRTRGHRRPGTGGARRVRPVPSPARRSPSWRSAERSGRSSSVRREPTPVPARPRRKRLWL